MSAPAAPKGFMGRFYTDVAARSAYSEGAGPLRIVPAAVALPADRSDVARLTRWASDTGIPLTPRGAGTGIPGGNVGAGVVVDLSAFARPLRVSLQQTANAGAAVTCRAVNELGTHFGFRLPPDPSSAAYCTVGGMVATNAAGARSLRVGSIRGWVRGVEFVTADGQAGWLGRRAAERPHRHSTPVAKRQLIEHLELEERLLALRPRLEGARAEITDRFPTVRKNSSGYALDAYLASGELVDLVVGSEGTLGIVTRAELALERLPGAVGTLLVALAELDVLGETVARLLPLEPTAIELLDRGFLERAAGATMVPTREARAALLVDFERPSEPEVREVLGSASAAVADVAMHRRSGVSETERAALWRLRHGASTALAARSDRRSLQVIEDGCVPVPALGRYLAGLEAAAREADIPIVVFGHAGDGHLHVNAMVDAGAPDLERRLEGLLQRVTALVIELGGTPSGEHGDGRLRATMLRRLYGDAVVELFGEVKRAFDPAGIMNPGVILPDGAPPLAHLKVGMAADPIPSDIASRLRERERAAGWAIPPLSLLEPE